MMPDNLKLDGAEVINKSSNGCWKEGRSDQLREHAGVFRVDAEKRGSADAG